MFQALYLFSEHLSMSHNLSKVLCFVQDAEFQHNKPTTFAVVLWKNADIYLYIWLTETISNYSLKNLLFCYFYLRPPVSYLVALNDKLQMNADKVERNIIEAEQNLSRVSTEQLRLWITNQSQRVYHYCCLLTIKHVKAP